MRKKLLCGLFWTVFACSSCSTSTSRPVTIYLNNSFKSQEVKWFNKSGNNTIKAQSFLRTRGGDVKTCAGYEVRLIPFSNYATERLKYLYGNTRKGFVSIDKVNKITFQPSSIEYYKLIKTTVCDASGKFKFENLPDGDYYIITQVIWEVPEYNVFLNRYILKPQGGYLMRRISLKGGETKEIVITYP